MLRDAAVVLYGPPASGKNTVGEALHRLDPSYQSYRRIKVGGIPKPEYRTVSSTDLVQLQERGGIIWSNARYGAAYHIDRESLTAQMDRAIPVLHVGQAAAIQALRQALPGVHWVIAELWCSLPTARQRILLRGDRNVPERLRAWHETHRLTNPTLAIDTDHVDAADAAHQIDEIRRSAAARADSSHLR